MKLGFGLQTVNSNFESIHFEDKIDEVSEHFFLKGPSLPLIIFSLSSVLLFNI